MQVRLLVLILALIPLPSHTTKAAQATGTVSARIVKPAGVQVIQIEKQTLPLTIRNSIRNSFPIRNSTQFDRFIDPTVENNLLMRFKQYSISGIANQTITVTIDGVRYNIILNLQGLLLTNTDVKNHFWVYYE